MAGVERHLPSGVWRALSLVELAFSGQCLAAVYGAESASADGAVRSFAFVTYCVALN